MLHTNYKSHFAAQDDNEIGNKNTSVHSEAWSPDEKDHQPFQTLILDANNVLLVTDPNSKIHTLHSFKVAGGTLLNPNTKSMCLLGAGSNAMALLLDKQSFLICTNW
jgi:hypothetical protein